MAIATAFICWEILEIGMLKERFSCRKEASPPSVSPLTPLMASTPPASVDST